MSNTSQPTSSVIRALRHRQINPNTYQVFEQEAGKGVPYIRYEDDAETNESPVHRRDRIYRGDCRDG